MTFIMLVLYHTLVVVVNKKVQLFLSIMAESRGHHPQTFYRPICLANSAERCSVYFP